MNYVFLTLLAGAFLIVECLVGGTRLLFSLPAYLLLAAAAVLTLFARKNSKLNARPACLISAALLAGYIVARCWYSPLEYLARADFFMVQGALAVYLITALVLVKPPHRMQLMAVLLLVAIGQTVVGCIQFKNGDNFFLFGYMRHDYGYRASGQYGCPNHLAGYLEVVAVFGLSFVVWSKWSPYAKILAGYASLVSLAGLVVTGSRGGYISTVFSLLIFLILTVAAVKIAFPKYFAKVILFALLIVITVGATVPFLVTSYYIRNRASNLIARDDRTLLWEAAVKQVKLEPIFGTGSGTYLIYGRKFRRPEVQKDPVRVHNDYLDLIAEYGAVGGACILLFLIAHLTNGFRSYRRLLVKDFQPTPDWRSNALALNIGCLCAVAAYLAHSVVDFNLHIPANAMLMAFVFGILANPGLETFQETKFDKITNVFFRLALPLLGIAIFILGAPKLPGEFFAEKARVALRDKKYLEAVKLAKKGIEYEKKNPDLYYCLGEARRSFADTIPAVPVRLQFYKLAADSFAQGIDLFPQDTRFFWVQGWTMDALGRDAEAGEFFRKALEWDPNSNQTQDYNASHQALMKKKAAKP